MDAEDDDEITAALKISHAQNTLAYLQNCHLSLLLEKHLQQNKERMRQKVEWHKRY